MVRRIWHDPVLLGYAALCAAALALLALQLESLSHLGETRTGTPEIRTLEVRPVNMERVFSFPENTCGPNPLPVFYSPVPARRTVRQSLSPSRIIGEQFRYGLLFSGCLLTGLLLGFSLTYRAAVRETRLAQMKSSFVSNVSHEMKTPLATIQMFAETLESGRIHEPAKLAEYSRVIHQESIRLGQMIENVLDFARMEDRTRNFRLVPTDLAAPLASVAEEYRRQIEHLGGTFTARLERLPLVKADPEALVQAVRNLLSNALKYSFETRSIELATGLSGGHAAITVADRGIGIPAAELPHIFDKFYRVDSGLVHTTKGAGLGLAIAKAIVHAHQGSIHVESEPGAGSRFTILLPVYR